MKKIYSMLAILLMMCVAYTANAQKFKTKQKEQIRAIKAAYKSHKVTRNEYNKLMDEQDAISRAIEKYEYDGYWDPHEKNVVHDKQERAADRLRRYKTNSERY
jgi:hypothetical protein